MDVRAHTFCLHSNRCARCVSCLHGCARYTCCPRDRPEGNVKYPGRARFHVLLTFLWMCTLCVLPARPQVNEKYAGPPPLLHSFSTLALVRVLICALAHTCHTFHAKGILRKVPWLCMSSCMFSIRPRHKGRLLLLSYDLRRC